MQLLDASKLTGAPLEIDAARNASSFRRVFSGKREESPAERITHAWSMNTGETSVAVLNRGAVETCPPEVYLG
jgi:hypothetical protein